VTTASITAPEEPEKLQRVSRRRWSLTAAVLGAAVLFTVAAILLSGGAGSPGYPGPAVSLSDMQKTLARVPEHGLTLGRPGAPVTVTEFADLQCPYCDAYTLLVFPRLLDAYVARGRVRMVFRSLSFVGPDSVTAARAAAAAAEQNRLWSFVDAFYYRQRAENSGYVTPAFLRKVATLVSGLNVHRLMIARRSPRTLRALKAANSAAKAEGVMATPTFIIARSGHQPMRVVGFAKLQTAITKALGR
jgi:protein-disulfide isomerase